MIFAESAPLFLVHVLLTWFMVGLIWTIQVVHYPLMGEVGPERFSKYSELHNQKITWIVGPVMLLEAGTGALLFFLGESRSYFLLSLGMLAIVWASTAFVQMPLHTQLGRGFSSSVHSALVRTNWIRTFAWSLRGVLLGILLLD